MYEIRKRQKFLKTIYSANIKAKVYFQNSDNVNTRCYTKTYVFEDISSNRDHL